MHRTLGLVAFAAAVVLAAPHASADVVTPRVVQSIVSFSAVSPENAGVFDDLRFLAPDGTPLDPNTYLYISPTAAQAVGELVQGPVLRVNYGTSFAILISGAAVQTPQGFSVTVIGKGATQSVFLGVLSPETVSTVVVGGTNRSLVVVGRPLQNVTVAQTLEQAGVSYKFAGIQQVLSADSGPFTRVITSKKQVIFKDAHGLAAMWLVNVTSARNTGRSTYSSKATSTPAGAALVLLYPTWQGTSGKPHLWLDLKADGTLDREIPLTRVPAPR
jgi:hypothetical protein